MKPLDPIALTRRLVDIESLTYNEGAVGEYLDTFLRERGFAVERMEVAQPTPSNYSGPRFNVYAGNGGRPDVVLSTHMDTVPPFIPAAKTHSGFMDGAPAMPRELSPRKWPPPSDCDRTVLTSDSLFVGGEDRDSAAAKSRISNRRAATFSSTASPRIIAWRWPPRERCGPRFALTAPWRIPLIRSWAIAPCTSWCTL